MLLIRPLLAGVLFFAISLGIPDLQAKAFQAGLNLRPLAIPAAPAQGSRRRGWSKKGALVTLGVAVAAGVAIILLKGEPREYCWFEGGIDVTDPDGTASRFRCKTR